MTRRTQGVHSRALLEGGPTLLSLWDFAETSEPDEVFAGVDVPKPHLPWTTVPTPPFSGSRGQEGPKGNRFPRGSCPGTFILLLRTKRGSMVARSSFVLRVLPVGGVSPLRSRRETVPGLGQSPAGRGGPSVAPGGVRISFPRGAPSAVPGPRPVPLGAFGGPPLTRSRRVPSRVVLHVRCPATTLQEWGPGEQGRPARHRRPPEVGQSHRLRVGTRDSAQGKAFAGG